MVDRQNKSPIEKSEQKVLNWSFDEALKVLAYLPLGYDGQNLQRVVSDALATKVVVDGTSTYIAQAAPGTLQSEAKWRVKKIDDVAGTTTITWCDGNSSFDNVATDLAGLNFS